jgi:hypothetical protein
MKNPIWAASAFVVASLLASNCSASTIPYFTQASFNAATTGDTTVTFGSLVANGTFNLVNPPSLSVGGAVFSINTATDNGSLYEVGANLGSGHYGADATLSSQGSTSGLNNLVITLPTGETALSILFNGFVDTNGVFTTDPVTITLSDGETGTVSNPAANGSYYFIGLTSTTPITSITLSDPGSAGNGTLNLAQLQYGKSLSATPEPSSASLLGLGMLMLVSGAAYRKLLAAGSPARC